VGVGDGRMSKCGAVKNEILSEEAREMPFPFLRATMLRTP